MNQHVHARKVAQGCADSSSTYTVHVPVKISKTWKLSGRSWVAASHLPQHSSQPPHEEEAERTRRAHTCFRSVRGRPSKRTDGSDRPRHVPMSAAASNSPFSTTAANGASTALIHIVTQIQGRTFSTRPWSQRVAMVPPHSSQCRACGRAVGVRTRHCARHIVRPWCGPATCQLFFLPPDPSPTTWRE